MIDPTNRDMPADPFLIVAAHDGPGVAVHLHTSPGAEYAEVETTDGVPVTGQALRDALAVVPDAWPVEFATV